MKVPTQAILFLLVTAALAGCFGGDTAHDDATIDGLVDQEEFKLKTGRGAIAGLLVDDRFRPIHLTASAQSEFQTIGFILLQETGQQVRTNANGEFSFLNIQPGTYTLRVTAEAHESVPQKVRVEEGAFSEITAVLHRTESSDPGILTQEFSVFKACEVTLLVYGSAVPCTLDLSGDTDRDHFEADYSEFQDATFLVTEFLANQKGFYEIRVNTTGGCSGNFAIEEIVDGTYIKIINKLGKARDENHLTCGNVAWNNEGPFTTIMYVDGIGKQETASTPVPTFGAGVYFAVEAKFVQSVFRGQPKVDLDAYCVLC